MAMRDKPGEPGRYAIRDNPSVKAPGSTKSSGASASRAWFTSAMSTIAAPSVSFDALQRRFARLFQDRDPLDLDDGTVVVVPSLTFPVAELRKIVAIQHYEERAIRRLRERVPRFEGAVVKLNNGFSGQGNAVVHREELTTRLEESRTTFCAEQESWATFGVKVRESGAVVEELLRVPGMVSPSVQLRITPAGVPRIVSSHDQVLGGPNDQVYLGCRFPADPRYRSSIQEAAMRGAKVLAAHGVIGSFGVDFFVVPNGSGFRTFLAEINLRAGGTTHPLGMIALASGGSYDAASGQLEIGGRAKHYVSTDNLKSHRLAGMAPARVIDQLNRRGLGFHRGSMTGATLHLLGALREYGKMGVTCVGDSPQEAEERYRDVRAVFAP